MKKETSGRWVRRFSGEESCLVPLRLGALPTLDLTGLLVMCVNTWYVCQGHRNEIKSYPPSVALCVDSAPMPLDFWFRHSEGGLPLGIKP